MNLTIESKSIELVFARHPKLDVLRFVSHYGTVNRNMEDGILSPGPNGVLHYALKYGVHFVSLSDVRSLFRMAGAVSISILFLVMNTF